MCKLASVIVYHMLSEVAITCFGSGTFVSDWLLEAIADHFVDEPGSQEVGAGLAWHGTEFDYVHADNRCAVADLAEEVEQLIPVQAAWFWGSYGGHFTGIERVEVDGYIGVLAQALPGNDGSGLC